MNTTTNTIIASNAISKKKSFSIITRINNWIEKEKENAIGISILYIIAGTMIASIAAALSIHGKIAYFPLVFSCFSAMGANVTAISQQSFKTVTWAFIFNILGNIVLIIYQLFPII